MAISFGCLLMLANLALNENDAPQEASPHWLAISSSDAEVSASWYTQHLGFKEFDRMSLPKRNMLIIFVKRNDFIIEISQRQDSVSPMGKLGLAKKSQVQGFFKFGFKVRALDPLLARLKTAGVSFYGSAFDDPRFGMRTAIIKDPDGNLIQLFQPLEEK